MLAPTPISRDPVNFVSLMLRIIPVPKRIAPNKLNPSTESPPI